MTTPNEKEAANRIDARLDELRYINDGWYDGECPAPTTQAFELCRDVLFRLVDIARFWIYPMREGGLQAEFTLGQWVGDIEFHNDGKVKANFFEGFRGPDMTLGTEEGTADFYAKHLRLLMRELAE